MASSGQMYLVHAAEDVVVAEDGGCEEVITSWVPRIPNSLFVHFKPWMQLFEDKNIWVNHDLLLYEATPYKTHVHNFGALPYPIRKDDIIGSVTYLKGKHLPKTFQYFRLNACTSACSKCRRTLSMEKRHMGTCSICNKMVGVCNALWIKEETCFCSGRMCHCKLPTRMKELNFLCKCINVTSEHAAQAEAILDHDQIVTTTWW